MDYVTATSALFSPCRSSWTNQSDATGGLSPAIGLRQSGRRTTSVRRATLDSRATVESPAEVQWSIESRRAEASSRLGSGRLGVLPRSCNASGTLLSLALCHPPACISLQWRGLDLLMVSS